MNILVHRSIPVEEARKFEERFRHHAVRFVEPQEPLDSHWDWVEILLGNPDPHDLNGKAGNLQWLQLMSSGMDAYKSLQNAQFAITTARGTHAPAIAQHILMMLLLLERRQWYFQGRQAARVWDRKARFPGLLRGVNIGLIGYGAIAGQLVKLLSPFDLKILAITQDQPGSVPPHVTLFEPRQTETVLAASDHLVMALPLTPATRNFLSRDRILKMKPGACFINVGRGELVDEKALTESLESGHLGGAALDVFEEEPLDCDSPLWGFSNCIVTPHIAGHHRDLDLDLLAFFAANLERWDEGSALLNVANFKRGY